MPLPIGPVVAGAVARAAAKKAATKAASKAAKKTAAKATTKAGAKKATTKGGDMTPAQYRNIIAQLEREVRKATGGKFPKYTPKN
jgi:hypothetical protein